ncbi:5'-nucleotidase C-terminal domain-containing protein [Cellulomonas telluris]|uniref:5'-nucleotidase C-terminal domain-containing protein n=1 Tax=Cellulomonas telluris TaxID=2306636 RepID=UPI0010A7FEFA|nr:5'-nucleotidase C-terminal domain-containing protein [Cellulomonas telluris]
MHVSRAVVGAVVAAGLPLVAGVVPPAAGDATAGWITGPLTRAYAEDDPVPAPPGPGDVTDESTLGNGLAQALRFAGGGSDSTPVVGMAVPTALRGDLLFDRRPDDPLDDFGRPLARVTQAELDAVLPSPEPVWTVSLTGAQLTTVLEQQWQGDDTDPTAMDGPSVHLGLSDNIRYSYDPSRVRGDRITSVRVNGAPLDRTTTYRVAGPASLIQGGHGFTALAEGADVTVSERFTDRSALDMVLGWRASPDFTERAIGVLDLPGAVQPEGVLAFRLTGLTLPSLDAPRSTALEVAIGGTTLTTWYPVGDVRPDDVVEVRLDVPAGLPSGPTTLAILVWTSGASDVHLPVTVDAGRQVTGTEVRVPVREQVHGDLDPLVRVEVTVAPPTAPGPVEIVVDGAVVASLPLRDGRALWQLDPSTSAGTYEVVARYPGGPAFTPSASEPVRVTVRPVATATTLSVKRSTVSWLPSVWASDVRLHTGAQPVGYVELREGTRLLTRARVVRGLALGTVPNLSPGAHRLTAVFVPDARSSVLESRSATVTYRR